MIPVWDEPYAELLSRAVTSVQAQQGDVPVVVVDNASDVELPVLASTTVVSSSTRLTAGSARNVGLEQVRTEYVIFLDADDELATGALGTLQQGIGADPGIAVFAMSLIEAETGRRHRTPRRFVAGLARRRRLFALATSLWSLYPIQGCAIMRTALVRESGGYGDCDGGEDWVLAASQAFRGRVVVDRRPGLVYHGRPGSLWRESRGTADLLAAARRVRDRLRTDAAVPAWVRATLPLLGVLQAGLIVVVRPVYRALRGLLRGRRARRQATTAAGNSSSMRNGRST